MASEKVFVLIGTISECLAQGSSIDSVSPTMFSDDDASFFVFGELYFRRWHGYAGKRKQDSGKVHAPRRAGIAEVVGVDASFDPQSWPSFVSLAQVQVRK